MARKPGRPSLDAADRSVVVSLRLPSRDYDRYCARAHVERVSVPDVIRRALRNSGIKEIKNRPA